MLMILLRSIHVVLGALWVGIAVFVAFFLMPSLKEIGPDANKVMVALQKRGMVTFVPAIAILTLLSGIGLLWKVSSGFGAEYMGSHMGMALSTGALAAIVGWTIGMTVVAPSMYKAATMSQALPTITAEAERNAQLATIMQLRARGAAGGRWTAILLLVAVLFMAVARYV